MLPDAGPPSICTANDDRIVCNRGAATTCSETRYVTETVRCTDQEVCVTNLGCRACQPGAVRCDGDQRFVCNLDGAGESLAEVCDPGEQCGSRGCGDLCALAAGESSYLGCDYVATTTVNSLLDPEFEFALVVANAEVIPANVEVRRGPDILATFQIAAGALETVRLPWINELRVPPRVTSGADSMGTTTLVENATYRVVSDVPITVHQFNPLAYSLDHDCGIEAPGDRDGRCYSYTNDTSLLLPVHALTGTYLGLSRATFDVGAFDASTNSYRNQFLPGFLAIVNPNDTPTDVTVTFRAHAHALEGVDPGPGDEVTYTLAPNAVLQLASGQPPGVENCEGPTDLTSNTSFQFCDPGPAYDLTGSEIHASAPVAVFGGHDCAFVPYNRLACDHLEEQLFPAEALGTAFVAPLLYSDRGEPTMLRIVSTTDGNPITIEPLPREIIAPIVLDRGGSVEIPITRAVYVSARDPILGVRIMVGQNYFGASGSSDFGDPAMGLLVPSEQFRNDYVFLVPDTYVRSYLDIVAPIGSHIFLDDGAIMRFTRIDLVEGSNIGVARVGVTSGVHRLRGDAPFGAYVYGLGRYTSYLVPVGLDVERISEPI